METNDSFYIIDVAVAEPEQLEGSIYLVFVIHIVELEIPYE